ncbi:hypothetical protein BDV95DRAFT_95907 [Massariosphaeria phaeospora]|uniref:Uncharacterized protein n=1 Tax=Massariosphaeria phaeospora TaxID=100035 RepID=A0A7C8I2Q1_9PLEO|nr:hypothetical protein BDV95DRAFT_95907 [Massariosphaeria phaeospora]
MMSYMRLGAGEHGTNVLSLEGERWQLACDSLTGLTYVLRSCPFGGSVTQTRPCSGQHTRVPCLELDSGFRTSVFVAYPLCLLLDLPQQFRFPALFNTRSGQRPTETGETSFQTPNGGRARAINVPSHPLAIASTRGPKPYLHSTSSRGDNEDANQETYQDRLYCAPYSTRLTNASVDPGFLARDKGSRTELLHLCAYPSASRRHPVGTSNILTKRSRCCFIRLQYPLRGHGES